MHMGRHVEGAYLDALDLLNISDLSRETGRALRTLQAYRMGERRVTEAAARELIQYLQARAEQFAAASAALEAALELEASNDEA